MSRQPRVFIPDVSAHVILRGNNRMVLFKDEVDHAMFLAFLGRAAVRFSVAVHAYVLMTNHLHILATPATPASLPRTMQSASASYAWFFNRKYDRIGTVWNGRYRALLIDDEVYWLTCLRYIEQNPLRAGMVTRPADYQWSSYAAHGYGEWPSWLSPHPLYAALGPTPDSRQRAYRALCGTQVLPNEIVPPISRNPGV
jgi:putative transposase